MNRAAIRARLDGLIDELTPVGTKDAAAVASILLASRAALDEGIHGELSQQVWIFRDRIRARTVAASPRRNGRVRGQSSA